MGVYSGMSFADAVSSNYTSVEPFDTAQRYNYHELAIIAASESAMNTNEFMKQIGLNELASIEQTGSVDMFYEAVNVKSVFENIKKFFQKIIEKIHKIFHTFIAKLSSWFSSGADFAKKYEKEVIKNFDKMKEDLDFKGYKFKHIISGTSKISGDVKNTIAGDGNSEVKNFLENPDKPKLEAMLGKSFTSDASGTPASQDGSALKDIREHLDEIKDGIRKKIVTAIGDGDHDITDCLQVSFNLSERSGYDQKEFGEELFKVFRGNEDSKQDLSKSDIKQMYGGSVHSLMNTIKDFSKIKKNLEDGEKAMVQSIDKIIKKMDSFEDSMVKDKANAASNEGLVSASAFYRDFWGFVKEAQTQAFGAALQAQKDYYAQAKQIAVTAIGLSKKVQEESTDMTGEYTGSSFGGFLENCKLR